MLVIVMHNNQAYLEFLLQLARKEHITDATIITGKNFGLRLIGPTTSFIYSKGKILDAYNKAFVAAVKGEEKVKLFIDRIERDSILEKLNIDDKEFLCTVPFHYIRQIELELAKKEEAGKTMKVVDFLTKDKILLDIKSKTKEEAIKEVASLLKSSKRIRDYEQFLKDIFERESLNTTGIGNAVAIPHARTDAVSDFVMAYGRAGEGIEFDSLDSKPVKFIFLMGTPKNKGLNDYLQLLAHLTRLLNKNDFQQALLKAGGPEEVVRLFASFES